MIKMMMDWIRDKFFKPKPNRVERRRKAAQIRKGRLIDD